MLGGGGGDSDHTARLRKWWIYGEIRCFNGEYLAGGKENKYFITPSISVRNDVDFLVNIAAL